MPSKADIARAVAVTAELTNTDLSEGAARALVNDLAEYPADQVVKALDRCRRELRGRLTFGDITDRLDDGRPGPEEAWNSIPRSETETVVWTEEMQAAYAACHRLINTGDTVAARMAFCEKYRGEVAQARAAKRPVKWFPTLGHDPHDRDAKIREAVDTGKISAERAQLFLPQASATASRSLSDMARKVLAHQSSDDGE